jgi:hypothetical protein
MIESNERVTKDRKRGETQGKVEDTDRVMDRQINEAVSKLIRNGIAYSEIHTALWKNGAVSKQELLDNLNALLVKALQTT